MMRAVFELTLIAACVVLVGVGLIAVGLA